MQEGDVILPLQKEGCPFEPESLPTDDRLVDILEEEIREIHDEDEEDELEGGKLKGGCCCGICCAMCEGPTCLLSFTLKFLILGVACGIAAASLDGWYWTEVQEHASQANFGGQTYDYKFYTLVAYGITKFCHFPQSIPDLNNNIDISIPTLEDWECTEWDNLRATVTQGSTEYIMSDCSTTACKKCRDSMENGKAWVSMGILLMVPVIACIIVSKCCHSFCNLVLERSMTFISIAALGIALASWVAGLRVASDDCADFNRELAVSQDNIWNATTNGVDNSVSSMVLGPSAYLGISTMGLGAGALSFYVLYFFLMSGASWLLFCVLVNGGLSVGFAVSALSFNTWYWTNFETHENSAGDNKFYSLISYGITKFCYYPRDMSSQAGGTFDVSLPSLDDLQCLGWKDLDATVNIDSQNYPLLSCMDAFSANVTTVQASACRACEDGMLEGEALGSLAIILTSPVAIACIVIIFGSTVFPKCCFGRTATRLLSFIGIGSLVGSLIVWIAALSTAAGKCDKLNTELKATTADLWSLSTGGAQTNGSELELGPSAYCAILAIVFALFSLLTFVYYWCTAIPSAEPTEVAPVEMKDG